MVSNRRNFIKSATLAGAGICAGQAGLGSLTNFAYTSPLFDRQAGRVGMIGLDTSHCEAFTKLLNATSPAEDFKGFPVTAAYPWGSRDIESSASRIPKITEDIKKYGVKITSSVKELLNQVDVVLLETNDGRPHLSQALEVINAGKPLFIDKPVAGSLQDAIVIYEAAKKNAVPIFSSSSLRFCQEVQQYAKGKTSAAIAAADVYSPCSLEKTHPDLFWYGIHGVEILFTIMGTGCKTVVRVQQPDSELVVGTWTGGRIGTFRGIRNGPYGYGGTVQTKDEIKSFIVEAVYEPLLKQVVQFFKTGIAPVIAEETLEIYAFMEAADESKRRGGVPVEMKAVMARRK